MKFALGKVNPMPGWLLWMFWQCITWRFRARAPSSHAVSWPPLRCSNCQTIDIWAHPVRQEKRYRA